MILSGHYAVPEEAPQHLVAPPEQIAAYTKPRVATSRIRLREGVTLIALWRGIASRAGAHRHDLRIILSGLTRSASHRGGDLAGDRCGSRFHRVACEMRVSVSRRSLGMPENFSDDREAHSARCGHAGEGVSQIMESNIVEPGSTANRPPW